MGIIQQSHQQCRYETFRINYSLLCAGFHLGNRRLVLLRRLRLSANHPTQSGQGLQHHCCHFAKLPEQVPKEPELQVDHQCNKDYLFVGNVAKYNKLYLCGSKLPTNLFLKSKARTMVLKFTSNSKVAKSGFKATISATG